MTQPLLDAEDQASLVAALERLEGQEENLLRAEQAEIDVKLPRERMEVTKRKIRLLLGAFFPNG